jgi:hypothetical protein
MSNNTSNRAETFGKALNHLRQSRELLFSLIAPEDHSSPLTRSLQARFDAAQNDVRDYGIYLLRLAVNARGEVVEMGGAGVRRVRRRSPDDGEHIEWT